MFPWVFIVETVLIGLQFFLIPGFVPVNVQFQLNVCDKLLCLQMLFLFFFFRERLVVSWTLWHINYHWLFKERRVKKKKKKSLKVYTHTWIWTPTQTHTYREWGCPPRDVMVKAMDCGIVAKRVRTLVALLCSLLDKYPWERYEPPYPPSSGLNSTTTVLLGE